MGDDFLKMICKLVVGCVITALVAIGAVWAYSTYLAPEFENSSKSEYGMGDTGQRWHDELGRPVGGSPYDTVLTQDSSGRVAPDSGVVPRQGRERVKLGPNDNHWSDDRISGSFEVKEEGRSVRKFRVDGGLNR